MNSTSWNYFDKYLTVGTRRNNTAFRHWANSWRDIVVEIGVGRLSKLIVDFYFQFDRCSSIHLAIRWWDDFYGTLFYRNGRVTDVQRKTFRQALVVLTAISGSGQVWSLQTLSPSWPSLTWIWIRRCMLHLRVITSFPSLIVEFKVTAAFRITLYTYFMLSLDTHVNFAWD